MMHTINTKFERPSKEVINEVAKQHVGVAGFEAGPRQVVHPNIKPLSSEWTICGPAFTVRSECWDDRLTSELAPKYAEPGDILVVDAGGYTSTGVWGLSMSTNAKNAGIAGIVIDGSCMNAVLLTRERPQCPIFTRGVSPSAKRGGDGPGSLNVPVICGGVIVYPGDIILGDMDGVVVLRPEMAQQIIANAHAHDVASRAANENKVPYYEQKDSEAKMRAYDNVVWNPVDGEKASGDDKESR